MLFRSGLGRVRLTPQDFGFTRGIGVQARNRHHEVVNRDVGHFFKLVFQAFAVQLILYSQLALLLIVYYDISVRKEIYYIWR